jgi:hypothetical protein
MLLAGEVKIQAKMRTLVWNQQDVMRSRVSVKRLDASETGQEASKDETTHLVSG